GKFPWHKYLDPKNDEFFKEGDYTPPAPFVEIARNPSEENIKNWFHYLALKNGLAERLQSKLEEFARTQSAQGFADPVKVQSAQLLARAASGVGAMAATNPSSKNYQLRLYFDSRCPHCEHMMDTLATLARQGFYVELRRVDHEPGFQPRFPFPVQQATPSELQKNQVEAVPVLLVGNLSNGTFFKIQGFQTPEAVLAAIREAQNKTASMSQGGQSS
ncbi:MAG: hypothetical protein AAB425_14270, partial [Bdellovibrionota bacterium]